MENKSLYDALAKAQSEFKTPKKDKKAHYGTYASIGSIHEAVRESMTKNGLAIIQPIVTLGSQAFVKTLITHSSGDSIESMIPIPPITQPKKNFFHELGSAISYLRRYALQSMLGISSDDVEDDGDSLNETKVTENPLMSLENCNDLNALISNLNHDNSIQFYNALQRKNVSCIEHVPNSEYQNIKNYLVGLINKQGSNNVSYNS